MLGDVAMNSAALFADDIVEQKYLLWATVGIFGIGVAAAVYVGANPFLNLLLTPVDRARKLSALLQPYDFIKDRGFAWMLRTKANSRVLIYEISGFDYISNAGRSDSLAFSRGRFYRLCARYGVNIKVHVLKRRIEEPIEKRIANPAAAFIVQSHEASMAVHFSPRYYLSLELPNPQPFQLDQLEEVHMDLTDKLAELEPRLLDPQEAATYMAELVNGRPSAIDAQLPDLAQQMARSNILFDEIADTQTGMITIGDGPTTTYRLILGIRDWAETVRPLVISTLAAMPYQMDIIFTAKPIPTVFAKRSILQRMTFRPGPQTRADLMAREEDLLDGDYVFSTGAHVSLLSTDQNVLIEALEVVRREITRFDVSPVVETTSIVSDFINMVPGTVALSRPRELQSMALAALFDFSNIHQENPSNPWGEGAALRLFTPYGFPTIIQHHPEPSTDSPAHSILFAPSGGGKSVHIGMLTAGWQRFNSLDVHLLDHNNGLEVITRALGGTHIDFDQGLGLNPFSLPDNAINRRFLRDLMLKMASIAPEEASAGDVEEAQSFVSLVYAQEPENRIMHRLQNPGLNMATSFGQALRQYVDPAFNGFEWFNATQDAIADLSGASLFTYEMSGPLQNPKIAALMLELIVHRIQQRATGAGRGAVIVVDEAAKFLEDPTARALFTKILREFRKLNILFIMAFQDPGGLMAHPDVAKAAIDNAPNLFFFRNENASLEAFPEAYDMTHDEVEALRGASDQSRYLLIWKTRSSALNATRFVDANLSHLARCYHPEIGDLNLFNLLSNKHLVAARDFSALGASGPDWLAFAHDPSGSLQTLKKGETFYA